MSVKTRSEQCIISIDLFNTFNVHRQGALLFTNFNDNKPHLYEIKTTLNPDIRQSKSHRLY